MVLTMKEWNHFVEQNPFQEVDNLHLTILGNSPNNEQITYLKNINFETEDTYEIIGRVVYLLCEGKYHQTKYSNAFFEKKLGCSATTRNWKTVMKLEGLVSND